MIIDPLDHHITVTDLAKGIGLLQVKSSLVSPQWGGPSADIHDDSGDGMPVLQVLCSHPCAGSHGPEGPRFWSCFI